MAFNKKTVIKYHKIPLHSIPFSQSASSCGLIQHDGSMQHKLEKNIEDCEF